MGQPLATAYTRHEVLKGGAMVGAVALTSVHGEGDPQAALCLYVF
jgi:hypothetical protein